MDRDTDGMALHLRRVRRVFAALSLEQEMELGKRIEAGDAEAGRELVLANLDVAITLARRYARDPKDFPDLVQEAYLGLVSAAEKYDWRQGVKFATYASYSVKSALGKNAPGHKQIVRLPQNALEARSKLFKLAEDQPIEQLSPEVIAKLAGISVEMTKNLLRYGAFLTPASLDDDTWMMDVEDSTPGPEQCVIQAENRQKVYAMLQTLNPQSRIVIELRYGLNGEEIHGIQALAGRIGKTERQVRKLLQRARTQLRRHFTHEWSGML